MPNLPSSILPPQASTMAAQVDYLYFFLIALSAFFWLPALLEVPLVKADRLRTGYAFWGDHLVWPRQLLWSAWGYGLSGPGLQDEMSFAIGPLHILLGGAGLVVALRSTDGARRAEAWTWLAVAATGAWLSTTWASAVWEHLPLLQYLALPWRSLMLPALFLALLSAFAFDHFGRRTAAGLAAAVTEAAAITDTVVTLTSAAMLPTDRSMSPARMT